MGELAAKIRAKYPGVYDSLQDGELESKVTAKYPGVYDHLVGEVNTPETRAAFTKKTVNDPAYREQMAEFIRTQAPRNLKQEAVRGLPMGNRIADATLGTYNNPVHPEHTVDATLGPQTQSATIGGAMVRGIGNFMRNPAPQIEGLIAAPADLATGLYKAAVSPESGSLAKFSGETVRGLAAPTGLVDLAQGNMQFPEARAAWEQNALGSGLISYGALKGGLAAKQGLADLGTAVANKAAVPLNAAAKKMTDMTLKQGTTLDRKVRDQNVKTALEGNFQPTSKGVDKLNAAIADTELKLKEGIASGDAAKVKGTLDKATANIEGLREQANRSSDPAANNKLIDAELERLQNHPLLDKSGKVDIATLQKMKVEQGRELQKTYGAEKPQFQNTIDKARVRGFKEELETSLDSAFPELSATNKQLGEFYQLKKSLERAANRIEGNQGVGIALPIKGGAGATIGGMIAGTAGAAVGGGIGTLIGIIEHPAVAPRLAQALYRSHKGKISMRQAKKITVERLDALKYSTIAGLSNNPNP